MNNAIFFTALGFAYRMCIDYFIYLETDCRVGRDNWDKEMFEDALSHPDYEDVIAFGSVMFNSPCNYDTRFSRLWAEYIAKWNTIRKNYPIPTFGAGGAAEPRTPNMFVNGALGVYNVARLKELFPDPFSPGRLAVDCTAWDFEIGARAWKRHQHDVIHKFRLMKSVFSSYGNAVTTEEERKDMLRSHEFVAVHQIEDEKWDGPQAEFPEVMQPPPVYSVQPVGQLAIAIVSHAKDLPWLRWCMASIRAAAPECEVHLAVPAGEVAMFETDPTLSPAQVNGFAEQPGKGHLEQLRMKCSVDLWDTMENSQATHVLHIDSDCVFAQPMEPDSYFEGGLPVMLKEAYANLTKHPRLVWKQITQATLGFPTPYETMCRHPSIYPRWFYAEFRRHIERIHSMPFDEYVLSRKADFPYGFCEFNAMGGFALRFYPEHFHWIEVIGVNQGAPACNIDHKGYPPNPLLQFWSHQDPIEPDKTGQLDRMGFPGMSPHRYCLEILKLSQQPPPPQPQPKPHDPKRNHRKRKSRS